MMGLLTILLLSGWAFDHGAFDHGAFDHGAFDHGAFDHGDFDLWAFVRQGFCPTGLLTGSRSFMGSMCVL